MKYQRSDSFKRDYERLSTEERRLFREAVLGKGGFHQAAEKLAKAKDPSVWAKRFRVRPMKNAPGICEMAWSFAGPDGRATFEWIDIEGEPGIRWRRIGGHAMGSRTLAGSCPLSVASSRKL